MRKINGNFLTLEINSQPLEDILNQRKVLKQKQGKQNAHKKECSTGKED